MLLRGHDDEVCTDDMAVDFDGVLFSRHYPTPKEKGPVARALSVISSTQTGRTTSSVGSRART
jgi:hypothetical protein